MKPSASASNLSVPLVAKQYHYTVDCDLRHKRSSPEDPSDDVFDVSEEKEEVEERPRKRMRVLGETDSEDEGKEGLDGTSEKDISKEEIEDNINRLTRLIEPLDKIKKDTSLFKDTLRRDHFNADFQPCVLKIENNIQELYMQLVKCRSFYSFLLDAQRPVQAEWGYFGMLPPELLLKIFSFLDGKDLAIAQCTCTFFRKVGSDESLWKTICEGLWSQDIALGQKPANKPWRWLFDCKMVRTSLILRPTRHILLRAACALARHFMSNPRRLVRYMGAAHLQAGRRKEREWAVHAGAQQRVRGRVEEGQAPRTRDGHHGRRPALRRRVGGGHAFRLWHLPLAHHLQPQRRRLLRWLLEGQQEAWPWYVQANHRLLLLLVFGS